MTAPLQNLLILQGGGPTAVLNTTLCAIVEEARDSGRIAKIIGARRGIEGAIAADLIDLSHLRSAELQAIRNSPAATLGSTRYKPTSNDFSRILDNLRTNNVRHLLLIGGNGSLRGAIHEAAQHAGYDLHVIAVPKTIDNDIEFTDRCPGYSSAARYVAQSVRDVGMDLRALPQPMTIFETMGRSVGWLAAASVLAKLDADHAPHLVYLPEKPFDTDRFLADADDCVRRLGWCVAVVSEGLRDAAGATIHEAADATQQDALGRALPGDVAHYLAGVVTQKLKIRCRSEKPGVCARSSMLHVSAQDRADADAVGRFAVQAAVRGETGVMVSLPPLTGPDQKPSLIPLARAAGHERSIPDDWLSESPLAVNSGFLNYAHAIVGPLLDYHVPLSR